MDDNTVRLAASWIETSVVAVILLVCGVFLSILVVRFFRGQTCCSCDSTQGNCPATKAASAIDRVTASLADRETLSSH